MKTIILTILAPHLSNIRSGKKTHEIRKSIPKCGFPFRVLCCQSGSKGKITAEFVCKSCFEISPLELASREDLLKECCVSSSDVHFYGRSAPRLYLWGVSDVMDYCSTKGTRVRNISEFGLLRAPQSWQYIEYEEN